MQKILENGNYNISYCLEDDDLSTIFTRYLPNATLPIYLEYKHADPEILKNSFEFMGYQTKTLLNNNQPVPFLITSGKHWVAAILYKDQNHKLQLLAMDSAEQAQSFVPSIDQMIEMLDKKQERKFLEAIEKAIPKDMKVVIQKNREKLSNDEVKQIKDLLLQLKNNQYQAPAVISKLANQMYNSSTPTGQNINSLLEDYSYSSSSQTGLFPRFLEVLEDHCQTEITLHNFSVSGQQVAESCGYSATQNIITMLNVLRNSNPALINQPQTLREEIKKNSYIRCENDKVYVGGKVVECNPSDNSKFVGAYIAIAAGQALEPKSQEKADHEIIESAKQALPQNTFVKLVPTKPKTQKQGITECKNDNKNNQQRLHFIKQPVHSQSLLSTYDSYSCFTQMVFQYLIFTDQKYQNLRTTPEPGLPQDQLPLFVHIVVVMMQMFRPDILVLVREQLDNIENPPIISPSASKQRA